MCLLVTGYSAEIKIKRWRTIVAILGALFSLINIYYFEISLEIISIIATYLASNLSVLVVFMLLFDKNVTFEFSLGISSDSGSNSISGGGGSFGGGGASGSFGGSSDGGDSDGD